MRFRRRPTPRADAGSTHAEALLFAFWEADMLGLHGPADEHRRVGDGRGPENNLSLWPLVTAALTTVLAVLAATLL